MNSLYTYLEEERPITLSRKDWLKWFEKYGDKENFVDAELWFSEMLQMQILIREEGSSDEFL